MKRLAAVEEDVAKRLAELEEGVTRMVAELEKDVRKHERYISHLVPWTQEISTTMIQVQQAILGSDEPEPAASRAPENSEA